jgi:hypothetical protein
MLTTITSQAQCAGCYVRLAMSDLEHCMMT